MSLMISLVLLPAREGLRRIAIRQDTDLQSRLLATSGTFLSVFLALFTAIVNYYFYTDEQSTAMVFSSVAAAIESFSEPAVVNATRRELYKAISTVRAVALISSGAVGVVSAYVLPQSQGVYSIVLSNLTHALVLVVGLTSSSGGVSRVFSIGIPNSEVIRLAFDAVVQSVMKFVLGNGEGFILLLSCDETSRGAYKLASNISSLAARFVFDRLEEQSFAAFSRLQNDVPAMEGTFVLATKTSSMIAMLFSFVGPAYSRLFVKIMYGPEWESAGVPFLLSMSLFYLQFISVNGIAEGYFNAVATSKAVRGYSMFTFIVMILYMGFGTVFAVYYGPAAIILANALNMIFRAVYCARFIARLNSKKTGQTRTAFVLLKEATPTLGFFFTMAALSSLTLGSERLMKDELHPMHVGLHLLAGFCSCIVALAAIFRFERNYVEQARKVFRREKPAKED
mmetsp:Transcript_6551/g.27909  ORF Transcript_6551/g.27909 Transcript_6551/m.27909 type:complete len:453 (+) Transcript_6551:654-2012(+)